MKRIAVGIGVLVAVAVLLTAGMGGVAAQTQATNETTESGNASFGATVSSFMQASSAEAEGEVDDGMFEASLNRAETAEERRALVEQRQEALQQRQQQLANRRAMLAESDSDVRSRAIAARVTTGASGLEKSVNGTEEVAKSVGVETTQLDELRTQARNLSGGEVAELARGLGFDTPARGGERGPPGDIRNGEDGTNVSVDGSGASNGGGPPTNDDSETGDGVDEAEPPQSDDGVDGRQADSNEDASGNDDAAENPEANDNTNESSGDAGNAGAD